MTPAPTACASQRRTNGIETLDALDHIAINDILCRFFLAFDERDWTAMEKCLAPEVFIDYSSSGREQARVMSGVEFVQRRRDAPGYREIVNSQKAEAITPAMERRAVG